MPKPSAAIQYPNSFADANPGFGARNLTRPPQLKSAPPVDAPNDSIDPGDDDMDKHELDTLV